MVSRMVEDLAREQHEITHSIHILLVNLKGAITREEAWALSPDERRDMLKIMEERAKLAQKMGTPTL
jgi:hypothetical protein